jgi:hypothetical protein
MGDVNLLRKIALFNRRLTIRAIRANQRTQETIQSAKAKLSILDAAMKMSPDAFRERLEMFLRKNGFEI